MLEEKLVEEKLSNGQRETRVIFCISSRTLIDGGGCGLCVYLACVKEEGF